MKLIGRTQISRALAGLGDFALSFTAFNLLLSLDSWAQGLLDFGGLFNLFGDWSYPLRAYFCFCLYRFYFCLLFGLTPMAFLLGLRSPAHWWRKRWVQGLKLILDFLLLPFLIFHWVAFWKGKNDPRVEQTFVEKLLGISLYQKPETAIQNLISFLVFPLFFLSLYSPLLSRLTYFDGLKLVETEIQLSAPTDFKEVIIMQSDRFGFQWATDQIHKRFLLFPDYQFVRQGSQLRLQPAVAIYDLEKKVFLQMIAKKEIRLKQLFNEAQEGQPFFSSRFPILASQTYGEQACEEIVDLVTSSLRLGSGSLINHTLRSGPFVRGFINLREGLLSLVDISSDIEVDLIRIAEMPILRFRKADSASSQQVTHSYLPLCTDKSLMFSFNYQSTLAHAKSYQDFLQTVLATSSWKNSVENQIPRVAEHFHVFHIIDFFTQLSADQGPRFEAGSLNLLNKTFKMVETENERLAQLLEKMIDITAMVRGRNKEVLTEDYGKKLRDLRTEVLAKDQP